MGLKCHTHFFRNMEHGTISIRPSCGVEISFNPERDVKAMLKKIKLFWPVIVSVAATVTAFGQTPPTLELHLFAGVNITGAAGGGGAGRGAAGGARAGAGAGRAEGQ